MVPSRHRAEEHEQVHLRGLHRDVKLGDQVERVVADQARQVEVLGEDQRDQNRHRPRDLAARQVRFRRARRARFRRHAGMALVPCAHAHQHHDGEQRRAGKPRDAALPGRKHDERRQQGTHRRPGVAAHLKQRLRQAVLSAGSHARHARRFRMEHRRAHADHRHRRQNHGEGGRRCDQDQPHQRERHAGRQRVRRRPMIGVEPHQRLQQRRRQLRGERDQPDLAEIQVVGLLQNRDRRPGSPIASCRSTDGKS